MPQILLVDCYDSFSSTIASYFENLGAQVTVIKSDDPLLLNSNFSHFSHVVLSPGPGHPQEYPILLEFIQRHFRSKPMLGICLGHQAIAHHCGAQIIPAPRVRHGKTSMIEHDNFGLMQGLKQKFLVMRYHSLVVDLPSCPEELRVDAWTFDENEKLIMGFHHQEYPLYGVQYHPESILSELGYAIFSNFLRNN